MPATERAFSELPPARLYIDTDFVLSYLVSTRPHHERTERFVLRLAEAGITTPYASSLVWIEFAHTVMRFDFRHALPEDRQREFAFDRWSESLVRQTYLEAMRALLETFLSHFPLVEVPLSVPVRRLALQNIAVYNLGAQDAAHLASASETGVLDLASFDRGYRRV